MGVHTKQLKRKMKTELAGKKKYDCEIRSKNREIDNPKFDIETQYLSHDFEFLS